MASKLALIIVFVFDVIAFGLAVAAEQRRSTATTTQDSEDNYNYCVYDSDISTGYGVGAFLFLLVSQAIIMVASRCFCCGKASSPGGSRSFALLLFIFCWVTFIVAESCLLAGSVRNAYHTNYVTFFSENPPSCQTVRKGVFAAGAAGLSSLAYYLSSTTFFIPHREKVFHHMVEKLVWDSEPLSEACHCLAPHSVNTEDFIVRNSINLNANLKLSS